MIYLDGWNESYAYSALGGEPERASLASHFLVVERKAIFVNGLADEVNQIAAGFASNAKTRNVVYAEWILTISRKNALTFYQIVSNYAFCAFSISIILCAGYIFVVAYSVPELVG